MVWSVWWQDYLKVFLFRLPAHCLLLVGRPLQQLCCKLLEEMPQLKKQNETCKQTGTIPETDLFVHRGDIRNESWFQQGDPETGLPQAWIMSKHLVALNIWMFREISAPRGTHCFLYARRQPWPAIKLLTNVLIFPLGKMCLHLGSARIALCLESYQSVLLPFDSALSSLIGIFVSEVRDKFIVFSS